MPTWKSDSCGAVAPTLSNLTFHKLIYCLLCSLLKMMYIKHSVRHNKLSIAIIIIILSWIIWFQDLSKKSLMDLVVCFITSCFPVSAQLPLYREDLKKLLLVGN